jgi:membrane protein CcdC involved in cytochrome C biogenesis
MENTVIVFEPLMEKIQEYGKSSFELYKLKTVEKSSAVAANFLSRCIAFLVILISLLMLSVASALSLGELLGKTYLGFLCVSAFYGVIGVILYFVYHNSIKRGIRNSIISQTLN